MTRRIVAALSRALREDAQQQPHVHAGSHGPYVCENPRCTSPSMDPRDY